MRSLDRLRQSYDEDSQVVIQEKRSPPRMLFSDTEILLEEVPVGTRVVAMVEPLALGLIGVIASVSIRADRSRLHSIFKELAEAPNVVLAAVCLGSWDLHTAVTARTSQELIGIVSAIQAVDGVLATDTSLMVEVVRLSPYMKRLDAAD